jgi:KDO2-lipid IV(A) lauroyltransferase
MKLIIRTLHSERCLNLLVDQDAGVEGIFVPFFSKPASTTATPALLSIRHDMPLLPAYILRVSPTRHCVHICPMLDPADLPAGTREQQVLELTRRHVAVLEDFVRRHPDQYFWFHRRWKTTPEYARAKLEKRRRKKGAKIRALQSITEESGDVERQP